MKVQINYDNGKYHDSFIIEGETLKKIRKEVDKETEKRNLKSENCWSEIIEE